MMSVINPSDSLASAVCNQCKRRKKRCDKALPTCGRCCKLQINCLYTPDPLEAESFSVPGPCPPGPSLSGKSLSGVMSSFDIISSLLDCSTNPNYAHASPGMVNLDEQVARYLLDLITRNGDDIDSICHRYFQIVEKWAPIIDRADLFERLGTLQTTPSASFSTLLLSICIFTQATSDRLDPRYYTVKLFLSLLQSTGRLSEEALQANILIAIYELSQSLNGAAELSIGICARVGMAMGLHRTLDSRIPVSHLPLRDIERQRRIWWCIIIIERIMNALRDGKTKPFASPDPAPYEYFPLDGDEIQDIPADLAASTRSSLTISRMKDSYSILLNSFTRVAQSVCLLQQVLKHIEDETIPPESKLRDAEALDDALQTFLLCLLREAGRRGDYCGSYSITLIALQYLHQHHLSIEVATNGSQGPSRSKLALDTAAKMVIDAATVSAEYQPIWDTMPIWSLHAVCMTILGRLKFFKSYEDQSQLKRDTDTARFYVGYWERRWKISTEYLEAINNVVARVNLSPHEQKRSSAFKLEDTDDEKVHLENLTISKKPSSSSENEMMESVDVKDTDI